MTGEISLSGEVKPVGGVYEKAFGARQAGMKGILIPEGNRSDIEEGHLGLTVTPVKNIREVLDKMLVRTPKTAGEEPLRYKEELVWQIKKNAARETFGVNRSRTRAR